MGGFVHDMMALAGVPTMMDANGVPVSFKPADGPAVPVSAILSSEWTEEKQDSSGKVTKIRKIMVSITPQEKPVLRNSIFIIGGEEWGVDTIDARDTYLVRVICDRTGRGETRSESK